MEIKRIKKLEINSYIFKLKWDKSYRGAAFSYPERSITIGIEGEDDNTIFMYLCHELMEIAAIEVGVRYSRPDCNSDYLFTYDHRQHNIIMNLFASLLKQFIK